MLFSYATVPPWDCEWISTLNEWRYFYPTHTFLWSVFILKRAKNAQLLQALLGIIISSSIQQYLGSVGKQLRADKRQHWIISPREADTSLFYRWGTSRMWWNSGSQVSRTNTLYYFYPGTPSFLWLKTFLNTPSWSLVRGAQAGRSEDCYLPFKNNLDLPQQKRDTSFQDLPSTWELFRFSPSMTDRVKCPTNYINLGAWSCGKEGRMKEEEGEGSHIDKFMPEKLVHTVRGLFGGWSPAGLFTLLDKKPGWLNTDRLEQTLVFLKNNVKHTMVHGPH